MKPGTSPYRVRMHVFHLDFTMTAPVYVNDPDVNDGTDQTVFHIELIPDTFNNILKQL
jgi:hypothetical protein